MKTNGSRWHGNVLAKENGRCETINTNGIKNKYRDLKESLLETMN